MPGKQLVDRDLKYLAKDGRFNEERFGSKSSLNRSKETSTPINGGSRRKEMGYAKVLKKAVVKALKGKTKQ